MQKENCKRKISEKNSDEINKRKNRKKIQIKKI